MIAEIVLLLLVLPLIVIALLPLLHGAFMLWLAAFRLMLKDWKYLRERFRRASDGQG